MYKKDLLNLLASRVLLIPRTAETQKDFGCEILSNQGLIIELTKSVLGSVYIIISSTSVKKSN